MTPDANYKDMYCSQNVFDPIDTFTFVAANTQKIALGTSVIDMLSHNPVILARRFAVIIPYIHHTQKCCNCCVYT